MNTKPTILAINPGTRYIGVAVFNGSDLVDWGVRVIEGQWSPQKLDKALTVVSDLILDYEPNILALKKTHHSRTSRQLDELCSRIESLAQEQRLTISRYSIEEIKAFCGQEAIANKVQLAKSVAAKYPALLHAFNRDRDSNNLYHTRMFEAVAIGTVCIGHIREASRLSP